MTKPPEKKPPRRPSAELRAMHQLDVILCELPPEVAYRVLRWALSCRETVACEPAPPLSEIEGGD